MNNYSSSLPIERLLSRLSGTKQTGRGKWLACCPAHDDKHASLSVKECEDGRVLLHCWAGCSTGEILDAMGLSMADLFIARPRELSRFGLRKNKDGSVAVAYRERAFSAMDVLRALSFEAMVVYVAATRVTGGCLTEAGRLRLLLATSRLRAGLDFLGGGNG
jgi:hypothetical protein